MGNVIELLEKIEQNNMIEILIAILVMILVILIAPIISKTIIKMCKLKSNKKEDLTLNPFYTAMVVGIRMYSLYILWSIVETNISLNSQMSNFIQKGLMIIGTIFISKALLKNFTINSPFAKNIVKNSKKEMKESMLNFILKTLRVCVYIILAITIMTIVGIDVTAIITGLGFGSVLITLSAQDTAKNLLGGLMIFLDKPFEVGDWVKTDKCEGIVEDISFRSTRIRLVDDSIGNVPNSVITNAVVTNYSKLEKRRYTTNLMFAPSITIQKIEVFKEKLMENLSSNEDIIKESIRLNIATVETSGSNLEVSMYVDTKEYIKYIEVEEIINYYIINLMNNLEMII